MIDSHAHLTDDRFQGEVEAVLARAAAAGIERVVTVATELADARHGVGLAERYEGVVATAGVHPHVAEKADAPTIAALRDILEHPRVVAVGETGLDYHYDFSPRAAQRSAFELQLRLASDSGLPIVVHAREADADLASIISEYGPASRGVLHSFSSGPDLLELAVEVGWYVSFSGMITFKNFGQEALLRSVPSERLLVETDSPYLAPVPFRGKRNEPAYVVHVARRAAELRGEDPADLAVSVTRNARAFYGLERLWPVAETGDA